MANHQISADRIVVIDEFEKEDVFLMGHLIFTPKQAEMAVRRWTKLQQYIKERLLSRGLPLHKKLEGEGLPEIHAEWLVQSGKYYRWPGAKNKDYWREHLEWLEEAMRVIRHVSPVAHYGLMVDHKQKEIERLIQSQIYNNPEVIKEIGQVSYDKLISILCNPYSRGFCLTLASMERMFAARNQTYEVICDNYDHCKGFSTLDIYREMHSHGITASAVAPKFLSSEDEQLIQMADVVTYGGGQVTWVNRQQDKDPLFISNEKVRRVVQDHQKYILPLDGETGRTPPPRGATIDALSAPIYMDMVINYVGIPGALRDALTQGRDNRIQQLLRQPK